MIDKLKKIMSVVLEISEDKIDSETSMETVDGWDSMRHMELITSVEEEFGIEMTMEEIAESITYFNILTVLKGKL